MLKFCAFNANVLLAAVANDVLFGFLLESAHGQRVQMATGGAMDIDRFVFKHVPDSTVLAVYFAISARAKKKGRSVNPPPFEISRPRPTLPYGDRTVPSALEGLTAVFGMGTGVAPPPWRPETVVDVITGVIMRRKKFRQLKVGSK